MTCRPGHLVLLLLWGLLAGACGEAQPEATEPSGTSPPTAPVTRSPSTEPTTLPPQVGYYVGPGPDGPDGTDASLYRYAETLGPEDYDTGTVLDVLTTTPSDPDYRTLWPRGSFEGVGDPEVGLSVVELSASVPVNRPEWMSPREAELALQQVVWTVREHYAQDRPDVKLVTRKGPVDRVFGIPTDNGIVRAATDLSVLSHMNITEPAEGAVVPEPFVIRGLANGFEGTAACYVEHPSGSAVWSAATIAGWQEDRLFSFELEVDLRSLPSGTYVLRCSTDDPTGGTEGRGADVDSRTIVVDPPGNPEPLYPIYYAGLTPDGGTGLFRCLEPNDTGEPNHGTGWYLGELTDDPTDPGYWTWWRRGTFTGELSGDDKVLIVEIRDPSYVRPRRSMTDADANLALQQLAWTMGAEAVQLSVDEAFGIDTSQPIPREGPTPRSC
jgi:hypothetical protein